MEIQQRLKGDGRSEAAGRCGLLAAEKMTDGPGTRVAVELLVGQRIGITVLLLAVAPSGLEDRLLLAVAPRVVKHFKILIK